MDRRLFLKYLTAGTAGLFLPRTGRSSPLPGGTLDPTSIPKYTAPLVIPPAMPSTQKALRGIGNTDYYEIAVRQFQQQILPSGYPLTTVWGYGSVNHPETFNYPSFTIEAKWRRPVRVKWINQLVDASGQPLPHLLTVDPTLHWANPPGGATGRDTKPEFDSTPGPYAGPVPMVPHVHGAHVSQESDGYPEAWWLPASASDSYARTGTYYDIYKPAAEAALGQPWEPGSAVFQYPNDQHAASIWYHDHTLGMTRLNVYAGPAGFYMLRGGPTDAVGGVLPGPAPALRDQPGLDYYEIPIAIQDRAFNADGSLFYPDTRAFFDGIEGPYIPESDISPYWNPEVFTNVMVVNGRSWPVLTVEPRRYRFRMLNGCNSRFLIIKIAAHPLAERPASAALPFYQIGAEGGFLPAPVTLPQLLMAPAERADVIVDFTGLAAGTELYLINEGPDEPFGGGVPNSDFPAADPGTTGQVMKFVVGPLKSRDISTPVARLRLPRLPLLGAASNTRQVSLNEMMSMHEGFDGPAAAMLGTMESGVPVHKMWTDTVTENPALNSTEVWELHNFTEDAHPIHLHLVQFQVVDREPLEGGAVRGPEPWETGYKDTVIAYPGEITRIKAKFDTAGRYVWHCHIVEHEDNEMMRPMQVG
ncbi:MAG TPA: multicopper oxidase [Bryobacteraceae bacterium]|nr:multicopper oxidase [Bryobacteraceae bacterium]